MAAPPPGAQANTIATGTGTGTGPGFSGDGGPAASAQLLHPNDVAATADGGYLVADTVNNRVRRVSPEGTIATVAGTRVNGFGGDGRAATAAHVSWPMAVAVLPDGGYLIAEYLNHRVRRVSAAGAITTVAGTGVPGAGGDGGPAAAAQLRTRATSPS